MRKARNTDHTPFPELDVDTPEAAGIVGHVRVQRAKDALHDARYRTRLRRVCPTGNVVRIVAEIDCNPTRLRIDRNFDLERQAIGQAWKRVVPTSPDYVATWQLPDGVDHAPFRIIQPLVHESLDRLRSVLCHQVLNLPFTNPGRADHRQIVPIPLLGNADAPTTQADNVFDICVGALHADAGEEQRPLFIDVARRRHIRGGQGIADIGQVGLGNRREQMLPLAENRHEDGVICGMGVP